MPFMNESELRGAIEDVRRGKLSRRTFTARMIAFGLTAPMATQMLVSSGVAASAAQPDYKPTRRGGGGALKALYWQAPTLLNPHFAAGTKDQEGSRVFYEPLAGWDAEGNLKPVLAAEIPTSENGGLAEDGTSVTWKLKQGVRWHDGKPFTADDCVFTWEYAADPDTAASSIGDYQDVKVIKVDDYTIRVEFKKPTPFWADALVGTRGMVLPKHLFEPFKGAKSREAPANLAPVGTGPYLFVNFKPGDLVLGKLNPDYHMPNRPHFGTFELKGGGDAVSAARAVMQTGEYDFAWNMQVEDEILKRIEANGKGHVEVLPGGNVESILLNRTDPWTEVDGERSSIKTRHPFLTDPAVRQALNLLVDRASVHQHIYGRTGIDTANVLNAPEKLASKNMHYEFNIDKAIQLLDDAGWKPGPDSIRAKNGTKLKVVFQTSTNAPRQKTQAIVKQACQTSSSPSHRRYSSLPMSPTRIQLRISSRTSRWSPRL
jgi:peptide/nickel transport system substrate-binding protein